MSRISRRFADLRARGRAGLITFLTAGDPDMATFEAVLAGLPASGADLIEVGVPFSDPMADGHAIQAAGLRALKVGTKLRHILAAVARFRQVDGETPIILMGYYNPIFHYGVDAFTRDAAAAGVDGLIIVDLPPEESDEFLPAATAAGLLADAGEGGKGGAYAGEGGNGRGEGQRVCWQMQKSGGAG